MTILQSQFKLFDAIQIVCGASSHVASAFNEKNKYAPQGGKHAYMIQQCRSSGRDKVMGLNNNFFYYCMITSRS